MNYGFQSEEQRAKYDSLRAAGYEYELTEPTGAIHMAHKEHGYDYVRTLETVIIENDGTTTKGTHD